MTTVNIAFSAGIDSTALLMMALQRGFNVNLHVINVSGIRETMMYECYVTHLIVEEVKKMTFKSGRVESITYRMKCPWVARLRNENAVCNSITQQLATVLSMADIRRLNVEENPGVWIGWNRADATEHSLDEFDHSEQDYRDLLDTVPKLIGRLGNSDNLETPFRAPLWDMDKKEIYAMLPQSLKDLVLTNGRAQVFADDGKVVYNAYGHKLKEIASQLDMELREHWEANLADIPDYIRVMCGYALPSDVDLPDGSAYFIRELNALYTHRFDMMYKSDGYSTVHDFKEFVHDQIKLVRKLSIYKPEEIEEEVPA